MNVHRQHSRRLAHAPLALAFLLAPLAACGLASPARAADPYNNSLDWVPADASVYSASLRLKEQIDAIAASNAWKTFREIPTVAQAWAMAEAQIYAPEGPAAIFWQVMSLPENKQMAQVVGEMFSDEIVFYAGADFVKLIELFQVIQGSRLAPLFEALGNLESETLGTSESVAQANPTQARMQVVLEAISEDPDLANVPELVFGFRIRDKAAATTQLARLEVIANMFLTQAEFEAKFERQTINETEFLVLHLSGSMIPFPDEAPIGIGLDEQAYKDLCDVLRGRELYVAIGLWNDYVLLSFGKSTDHLKTLGAGPAIGGRTELASLARFRDRKLVSASYASREVVASQLIQSADLDEIVEEFTTFVDSLPNAPSELKERIVGDLELAAGDFRKYLPVAGATSGFQFMTDTGFEGYSYSWAQFPTLDGSKPLELAQHVGGSPILALVARGVDDPEAYNLLAKWVVKIYGYVEDYAVEQMDEHDREHFDEAMRTFKPLIARFDSTTRDKLIPALADGQSGLVIDADIASKQWHAEMPASFEPLPMLELAIVVGVTDRSKLVDAMADYRDIINALIDITRELHPDDVPAGLEFPEPSASESSAGTIYAWKLNSELGLDAQIVPAAAVNDHMAVLATSQALAERALAETPLAGVAALGPDDQNRSMIVAFNWADLVTAAEPWVVYGIRQNMAGEDAAAKDPSDDDQPVQEVIGQVKTGLSILKCFRGAWADSQREGDAWVTHSIVTVEDLND